MAVGSPPSPGSRQQGVLPAGGVRRQTEPAEKVPPPGWKAFPKERDFDTGPEVVA